MTDRQLILDLLLAAEMYLFALARLISDEDDPDQRTTARAALVDGIIAAVAANNGRRQ